MKKFKRILASILCVSVLISSTTYAQQNVENNEGDIVTPYGVDFQKQEKSYEDYEKIMEAYEKGGEIKNYYCGAYLDEKKDLIILIDENFKCRIGEVVRQIKEIIKNNNFRYSFVKYNYDLLNNGVYFLKKYMVENPGRPVRENMASCFLDEKNNCIKVHLKDTTATKVNEFKEATKGYNFFEVVINDSNHNHNVDKCKNNIRLPKNTVSEKGKIKVQPGTTVKSSEGVVTTVGYKAKDKEGKTGIVTAEHLFDGAKSNWVYIGSELFGKREGSLDKSLDAVFINNKIKPELFDISNTIDEGHLGKGELTKTQGGLTGMFVFLKGGNHLYWGNIVSNCLFGFNAKGNLITDLICTDFSNDSGDSGGALYTKNGTSKYSLVGTNVGVCDVNGGEYKGSMSVCTRATDIRDKLGVTLAK